MGYRYPGNLNSFIDWSVYFFGSYAPHELEFLKRVATKLRDIREELTFWDVGANVGNHSLFMSLYVDTVYAFEPHPINRASLEQKVSLNKIPNLRVVDLGLGNKSGKVHMKIADLSNPGTAHVLPGSAGADALVSLERGDDFAERYGVHRVDVVKIDVEGYEMNVFRGMRNLLRRDRPVVLFEIQGADRSGFVDEASLRHALYPDHKLFSLLPKHFGPRRFTLVEFDIKYSEAVAIPGELLADFRISLGISRRSTGPGRPLRLFPQ